MENETFHYTYSAKEQEDIQRIRDKYEAKVPQENKLDHLRRLDQKVSGKAAFASVTLGIIGALLLGVGMCCTMVWRGPLFIPGIVIGVAGIVLVALAYPLYGHRLKKERERIAPEVLKLTDELGR